MSDTNQIRKYFITGNVENSVDSRVYKEVLQHYSKESITLIDKGNMSVTVAPKDEIERVVFTENEIFPFHSNDLDLTDINPNADAFIRKPSLNKFSSDKIKLKDLKQLLISSFAEYNQRRPYPSGGGLYPVNVLVFIFAERVIADNNDQPLVSGCYNFLPVSKSLQLIKEMPMSYFYNKLLHGMINADDYPAFCFLYLGHIAKSLFKYRYRGYRHAMLETGSMYQSAIFHAQKQGLESCVWGSFSENEFLCELDLDYSTYMPIIMQLFGYNKNV